MLLSFLLWLDDSPWRFWTLCGLVYAVVLALAVTPGWPQLKLKRGWQWIRGDAAFVAALAVMLLAFRWPVFFYQHQLNPDESGYMSQTLTLRHDPVFWRSVTAGTSGPVNIYPRLLPSLFGFPVTYFTSRVMALIIIAGILTVFYFTCRRFATATFARLATLAPATFLALTTNGDFVHYSGEHMPVLLLATASYLALRLPDPGRRISACAFLAGCLLGAAPFAKLQAGVFALTITIFCYVFLLGRDEPWRRRWQRCGWLTLGGITIPLLVAASAKFTGCFEHFWRSYLVMNLGYASCGAPWWQIVPILAPAMPDFAAYFLSMVTTGVMGLVWITIGGRWRRLDAASLRLLVYGSATFFVAIFTALAPGRPWPHYYLFVVLPLAGWAFAACRVLLCEADEKPPAREVAGLVLAAWCTVALFGQFGEYLLSKQPHEMRGRVREFVSDTHSAVAEAVLQYTAPGQPLGLWGWTHEIHVETGTWRATSDLVLEYLWNVNVQGRQVSSWREVVPEYFQELYVADLKRSNPPVFVDAVAPGSFTFADRATFGYETFPALAAHIDENYDLRHEIDGIRIFVRKDVPRLARSERIAVPSEQIPDEVQGEAREQYQLGLSHLKAGRTDEAVEYLQRTVELVPDFAEARHQLGTAFIQKKRMDMAVTSFREEVRLKPGDAAAQCNLADTLLRAVRLEEAVVEYQNALKIDPNHIASLNNLAWVLGARGDALVRDGAKAIELAERANKLLKGNPALLNTLAAAYGEAGRYAEALDASQRALDFSVAQRNEALAQVIREARACYQSGKPYHTPLDVLVSK